MDKAERSTLFYFKVYDKFTIFRLQYLQSIEKSIRKNRSASKYKPVRIQRQMVSNKGNKAIK